MDVLFRLRRPASIAAASCLVASVAWSQTSPCPAWTVEGNQFEARIGRVASAGDVNGDGYRDVIVGAPVRDSGQTDEGRASVYLGSSSGLATIPIWTADGDQAQAHFGHSVAGAGDVNGDGYDDVIVGAPDFDNPQTDEGIARVYLGSPTGPAAVAAWTAEGNQGGALFGFSVSAAGDVNGDGFGDVIVGAPRFDNGEFDEGRAFVYLGSATGLATVAAWTAESDQAVALSSPVGSFGNSVGTAGDVNGDGYDDVIVGDPRFGEGLPAYRGSAFVYTGSATGLSLAPAWTEDNGAMGFSYFGASTATAGDVNGDGFDDVIVGAPRCCDWKGDESSEGHAYGYLGSALGLAAAPQWSISGPSDVFDPDSLLGDPLATAGDVNGDGFDDVVVTAAGWDEVYSYLGSATGLRVQRHWMADGDWAAGAGDVNGDGYDDVLVGFSSFNGGFPDEGRVQLYLGSAVGLVRSAVFAGDGINADEIAPQDILLGSSWTAPLTIHHPHGTGGALTLMVRTTAVNGPNLTSPFGGRTIEFLVSGATLGTFGGTHDGSAGGIAPQAVPGDVTLLGVEWAAQYVVLGGGFADLSQAVVGVVHACP